MLRTKDYFFPFKIEAMSLQSVFSLLLHLMASCSIKLKRNNNQIQKAGFKLTYFIKEATTTSPSTKSKAAETGTGKDVEDNNNEDVWEDKDVLVRSSGGKWAGLKTGKPNMSNNSTRPNLIWIEINWVINGFDIILVQPYFAHIFMNK